MDEKKVMSEEAKKEACNLIESKIGTQIDGLENYLRELYQLGAANDCGVLKQRSIGALRRLNDIRTDFQIVVDLDLF